MAAVVLTVGLLACAAAVGARRAAPGRYRGSTSGPAVNGFKAPVAFTVSRNGKELHSFAWAGLGCFGAGHLGSGDVWKGSLTYKVGTVKVKPSGAFATLNARTRTSLNGGKYTEITSSTVRGSFKSSNRAVGTISFSQYYLNDPSYKCHHAVSFTAAKG